MTSDSNSDGAFRVRYIVENGNPPHEISCNFPTRDPIAIHTAVGTQVLHPSEFEFVETGETGNTIVRLWQQLTIGTIVTVWYDIPLSRKSEFLAGGMARPDVLNIELDHILHALHHANATLDDAIRTSAQDNKGAGTILPPAPERAGRFLCFDPSGGVSIVTEPPAAPSVDQSESHYLGDGVSLPTQRVDQSDLRPGDLFTDRSQKSLKAWSGDTWTKLFTGYRDYLHRTGDTQMSGSIDLSGSSIVNIGAVDIRDIQSDGIRLDALARRIGEQYPALSALAARNAWNLAEFGVAGPGALGNLYLDTFSDQKGIAHGTVSGAAVWDDTLCGTITVRDHGQRAEQSGSSSTFQYIVATQPKSSGRYYVEIEHVTTNAASSAYTWHGIRLSPQSAVSGNPPPSGYILCSNDGDVFDGESELPRPGSFSAVWPANSIPNGTRGAIALDLDAGAIWLGFVNQGGSIWWHGDGNPEFGQSPSATFATGTEVRLAGGVWGGGGYIVHLNAGHDDFEATPPLGFVSGWHEDDADTTHSENAQHIAGRSEYRPLPNYLAALDPNETWTDNPRWQGYRSPVVSSQSYRGRPAFVHKTGGSASPTMLHYDWTAVENAKLVAATEVDVEIQAASSHITAPGAGYGMTVQTCWVDDHDTPTYTMRLGANLADGKVQSLQHPGGYVSNPCPSLPLIDDAWYTLRWHLTKPAGFAAADNTLTFYVDGTPVWAGTFAANPSVPVESGVWGGSDGGLQFWHQHDGYPAWIGAISAWTVRTDTDPYNPMHLVSREILACDIPDRVQLNAEICDTADITENSDFIFSVSRDNGETWATVPVSPQNRTGPNTTLYSGETSLMDLPERTRLRVRMETYNGSGPALTRWALRSDQSLIF